MRVAVIGAGVGGLACAVELAGAGVDVVVLEANAVPGGKVGRRSVGRFTWDSGPSLLTMPWVFREALGEDCPELEPIEPVTRYAFADGSSFDMSADRERARAALEAWSPGAGDDWLRYLAVVDGIWRAAAPLLSGPPPWPPERGAPAGDPRALLAVRPWHTLRSLAEATLRDPRLRLVAERSATYAGADPRRTPAALALAGYVEHAFGAWRPRGGMYTLVEALAARLERLGGELRLGVAVEKVVVSNRRARAVLAGGERIAVDAVVGAVDTLAFARLLGRVPVAQRGERSLSGLAVMLGLSDAPGDRAHHSVTFPGDYDAEFDDVFVARWPVRDPTLYVSTPAATAGGPEAWFVLVNAPSGTRGVDWEHEADRVVARLGVADRVEARTLRTPEDLEAESGAVGGAIYGRAPHGRLGTLNRPGNRVRGLPNVWATGGTVHPGGGLPLVVLGGRRVARQLASGS